MSRREAIIQLLSEEIFTTATQVGNEQEAPASDADKSDQYIADGKATVLELRRIREELENLWTGIILDSNAKSVVSELERYLDNNVARCGHGFISATCGQCMAGWQQR